VRGARPAPRLVPNPRPRTPRFRPPFGVALAGLYPLHFVLGGLVVGLVAGPRAGGVVGACVVIGASAALVLVRSGRSLVVPLAPVAEAELERLGVERPSVITVRSARAGGALACTALAVLVGAVVAEERLAVLDRTSLVPRDDARIAGFVVQAPRMRAFGTTVAPVRVGDETILVRAPDRTRFPRLRVGDELVARGRLRALRPRDAFERRRGVHAILEAERVAATGRARAGPLDLMRRRAEDALAAGHGHEQAALARGMVLGQDEALGEELREAFRVSGLAHLLAASGQNVMLLAALVLGVATVAGVGLRARLGMALVAVAFYVPLAGAGPSIQRAGVMGAAGLVAAIAGRPASRWYALLLAATATLILNPRTVEDPGWQLSFAAVVAILGLHRRLSAAFGGGVVGDVAALTVAATLGTAPLLSLHFGQLPLVSLPVNLLAAPAVAPVMWLGTLAGVAGSPAAELFNAVAALPLAYLAWLGRTAAALPHASLTVELPGPLAAAATYAVLAVVCVVRLGQRPRRWLVAAGLAWLRPRSIEEQAARADERDRAAAGVPEAMRGRADAARWIALRSAPTDLPLRPRWSVIAALGAIAVAAAFAFGPGPARPPAGPTLSLLDVGQGDAVLLQHGERAALFDTGRPGAPLVRELRAAGVERLDLVVVTHSSSDHEGGLPALLRAMPVGLVLDGRGPGRERGGEGGGARFEDIPATVPRGVPARGQTIRLGAIGIEILWPPPGEPRTGDPNLTATVALVRAGSTTALLTADAESEVTLPLDLPPVDILKVAHHGSEDAGLPRLLEELRPRRALIPVGANTYGHPAPSTLAALRSVPDVRRTDRDGTIRVALAGAE
jgi:competence protein ComEC